jgi:hypothetical protein
MPLNRGTQKQIAQRFQGNLGYFRQAHYWRRLRFLTILILSLAGTAAMAWLFLHGPEKMYNPGPISQHHLHFAADCAQCHEAPKKSLAGVTLKFTNEGIDQHCDQCHQQHSNHHPSVVTARSCTTCHQEHEGTGPMAAPGDVQCVRCHGDAHEMTASAAKGKSLGAAALNYRPDLDWKVFKTFSRSTEFATVTSFVKDHPEFRVADRKLQLRETNTLMFNHYRHLVETNDIPALKDGRRLDCGVCHEPAAGGAFMRPISYERHCQACHSLQFDPENPDLKVPHGRAEHARAFLRSLPLEYADIAQRKGIKEEPAIKTFVATNMQRLQGEFTEGSVLENLVLLTVKNDSARTTFLTRHRMGPAQRAQFDGCATCHEVIAKPFEAPAIVPPWIPDRWMVRAHFDHSKHRTFEGQTVACVACHAAAKNETTGRNTADILMPSKMACIGCHNPQGKVASDCSTCHKYHAPLDAPAAVTKLTKAQQASVLH